MKCREVAFKGNREIASLKDREQTITPCYFFLYCVLEMKKTGNEQTVLYYL